jgi:hypothetical protein
VLRPAFVNNQRLPPRWSHTTTTGKETLLLLLLPPPPTPATAVLRLCCLVTVAAVYTVHVQVTERSAARQTFFFIFVFFSAWKRWG